MIDVSLQAPPVTWKTFRVALAPFGTPDWGMFGGIYQKVYFTKVKHDDAGLYDLVNYRVVPAPIGCEPRPFILHAQLLISGGLADGIVAGNCKILRNATISPDPQGGPGHYEANEPVSGVFGGFSGAGAGHTILMGIAQPGDWFEVWTMCDAWQTGQPAQNAPGYGSNTFRLQTHYAHSFLQGMVEVT